MSEIYLSPYVNFQGQARAALEFYHQILGGTLDLHTVNAQGESMPAGPEDRVAYARLEAEGVRLVGGDGHPAYPAQVGENMALALGGTDQDRLTRSFNALAEGGKIKMPLAAQPRGGTVGWLTDKFGINWMVQIDQA